MKLQVFERDIIVQRRILLITAIAVGLTRLLALSRSLWDWDEALFCVALRAYDIVAEHPHPPGFPLYVLAGRFVHLFVPSEFRALQTVNLVAGVLLCPAVNSLARAFRLDFATALSAGLLFAFLPNVWFLGGTTLSDVPGRVLLLFAIALLLRGREERSRYCAGNVLLALALSFRPQNALLALYPWLAASWARGRARRSDPVLGALVVVVLLAVVFGSTALLTGPRLYWEKLQQHSAYVLAVDGFRNPGRPPWWRLMPAFLLRPFGGRTFTALTALAGVGLLERRRRTAEVLLTFGPVFVSACFLLNPESISRYAIVYLPMTALLAAAGARFLVRRESLALQGLLIAPFVVWFIIWTLPALREVRTHDAPPVRAMLRAKESLHEPLYVHETMRAWADAILPPGTWTLIAGDLATPPPPAGPQRGSVIIEGLTMALGHEQFTRPRNQLSGIARPVNFEVSILPIDDLVSFSTGWYGGESAHMRAWRWMGRSATIELPPLRGNGTLHLVLEPPPGGSPIVTFAYNGIVIDRKPCAAVLDVRYTLPSRTDGVNTLRIDTSTTFTPPGDARELGLRLTGYSWR